MTIIPLNPGCFGSALFYRCDAVECVACPVSASCAPQVKARAAKVIGIIGRFDQRFKKEIAQDCLKWFEARLIPNRAKAVSSERNQALLTYWSERAINVHHLAHGRNPIETPGGLTHAIFAEIIEAKVFKPRDIVEAIQLKLDRPKSELTTQVKKHCDALVYGGILRKENHVLCLKN